MMTNERCWSPQNLGQKFSWCRFDKKYPFSKKWKFGSKFQHGADRFRPRTFNHFILMTNEGCWSSQILWLNF